MTAPEGRKNLPPLRSWVRLPNPHRFPSPGFNLTFRLSPPRYRPYNDAFGHNVLLRSTRPPEMRRPLPLIFAAALVVAGCAARPRSALPGVAAVPVTRPSGPAFLALDEIVPRPVLPTTRPTTSPTIRPPMESLLLYAYAHQN